jgi:hypothetical protein
MMYLTKTHALKVSTRDGRIEAGHMIRHMHTNIMTKCLCMSPNLQDTGSMKQRRAMIVDRANAQWY